MKKIFFAMLYICSFAQAAPRALPPVIDNSMYPAGAAGMGASISSANAMYEVLGRLEQLQQEVQQLRGVVEEQSQTINHLKKRQGNIYSDLDLRIQDLSKANLNLHNAVVNGVAPNQVVHSNSSISPKAGTSNSLSVPVKPDITDKTRYQAAYEMLRNGHNSRSIVAFQSLIADFPQGEYADNSQYWLGEAYKVNQNMDAARDAFLNVVMNYAGSPKVPDALLKLGYIEFEHKNIALARDYFTQVTVAHPDTTAAHLATKKLLQLEEMQR